MLGDDDAVNRKKTVSKDFSRRKFGTLLVSGVAGTAFSPLNVAGKTPSNFHEDQSDEVKELYLTLEKTHDGLKTINFESINSKEKIFRQILVFNDGTEFPMTVEKEGDAEIITVNNKKYHAKIDKNLLRSSRETDIRSNLDTFSRNKPAEEITVLDTGADLSVKASRHTSATGCEKRTNGAGHGQTRNNCEKWDFRAEAAVTGSIANYTKAWTDVYIDVFIDEPSNQTFDLEVNWNDYAADFELLCASGSARGICSCKIADLSSNSTLTSIDVLDKNKTVAELRGWHKNGTQRGITRVNGQTTYRVGIRAVAGIFTAGVSAATADVQIDESRFEVRSVSISLEHT